MVTWRLHCISRLVFWVWLSLSAAASLPAQDFDDQYDQWFREYSIRYLYGLIPDDDWKWFKAQCYQESRLIPDAVSPAGAVGVCQLMKGAADDAGLSPHERLDPRKNIQAGAYILRRNIRTWWPRETRFQRLQLGWAGYNSGAGNVIKAQQKCGGPPLWPSIAPCLHMVTGFNHSYETITYVALIPKWYMGLSND